VSAFRLDKYEVTVGRFRSFVETGEGTRQHPPTATAGAHVKIPGSGWDSSWNINLTMDASSLIAAVKCDPARAWTDVPGTNEGLPMNCVTWYEAAAFCSWDGGYLPTEAEWNFAAAGGDEQRAYPWSTPPASTAIDCAHANYAGCVSGVGYVGDRANGDGKWGQSDLAGNALEWILDWAADPYPTANCDDCANLLPATGRILRGGSVLYDVTFQRASLRKALVPTSRFADVGFRCARN
jgi:formylglycine-generating enzyme required for sulfatase activity